LTAEAVVVPKDRCRPEPVVTIARSVAEVLSTHVQFSLEGIDRLYLSAHVPILQREAGIAWFLRRQRGARFASSVMLDPISKRFIAMIEQFAAREGVEVVEFEKGQRKDDVMKEHLAAFTGEEAVLFIGKAQEKAKVVRTQKRRDPKTGATYPWLVPSTAMVNHYYFYCVDRDFGPFFLKFCSYFPYNAKLCINGHEYLKRQLAKEGIRFEALDNGLLSCADVERAQQICDGLSPEKIDALLRKWLHRLPHPFLAKDRAAGYRYILSVLQAEFSLTQVLDRPLTGRVFFEEVIRENLDIGRPDRVQLIFERRIARHTPGTFRTRVLTEGVTPSLHVDYKRARIKQYHKEGRALRTETTVNDTYDFRIGRRLRNLPKLRKIGFTANRRLLEIERISHDCTVGEKAFERLQHPVASPQGRAAGLRFGDRRVQALLAAVVIFALQPRGFSNRDLRQRLAPLLGLQPDDLSPGRMTYDLRRLRLHGVIERIRGTHRYQLTADGRRTALFNTRVYARVLRPGLSLLCDSDLPNEPRLRATFHAVDEAVAAWCTSASLASA
jgi:hypothetical protein